LKILRFTTRKADTAFGYNQIRVTEITSIKLIPFVYQLNAKSIS